MKKVKFSLVALMAVFAFAFVFTMNSCQKATDDLLQPTYAAAITVPDGDAFIIEDGDVTLKAAPLYAGHDFMCLDQFAVPGTWNYVDGNEFLPGSAAQLDWGTTPLKTKWWFATGSTVRVTYCPAILMRFVSVAKTSENGTPTYLGLYDCTPSANSFPITLKGRRLGDVLKINVDALTKLPGYSNMHFEVIYNKHVIDVNGTIFGSTNDTKDGWPSYVYSGAATSVTFPISAAQNVGMQTVYDDVDATIDGTITVKIYVDNAVITKTVQAPGNDKGLAITLTTNKVGWYDSANIGLQDIDITVDNVDLPVNTAD